MSSLEAFACGETSHDMRQLLRGAPRGRRVFPAGVFRYESGDRRVLYDTGYAPEPWRAGLAGHAYRRLLPPVVRPGDTIAEQLDPADITHVVLSHLHPDHVGGIRFFPHATFVMSAGVRETLDRSRLRDGVLRRLLPPWFPNATTVVIDGFRAGPHDLATHDLFGDGALLLVDLPGHARGHLGALVEQRVLLAGDAAWGHDLLGEEHRIRAVPRAVGHDAAAQERTARRLLAAERDGITVLLSHDPHPSGIDLLATRGDRR